MGDTTRTEWSTPPGPFHSAVDLEVFESIVVENEDLPAEAIIYPANDLTGNAWIVANGRESFVSLESMR